MVGNVIAEASRNNVTLRTSCSSCAITAAMDDGIGHHRMKVTVTSNTARCSDLND